MNSVLDAPWNQILTLVALQGSEDLTLRLREMGFREGVHVRVIGQAPFRGPLLVEVHNALLALRKMEAACLKVQWT